MKSRFSDWLFWLGLITPRERLQRAYAALPDELKRSPEEIAEINRAAHDARSGEFDTCADAAAACPFKPGDVVMLKSGGHAMTVNYVTGYDCEIVWSRDGEIECDSLNWALLERAGDIPF